MNKPSRTPPYIKIAIGNDTLARYGFTPEQSGMILKRVKRTLWLAYNCAVIANIITITPQEPVDTNVAGEEAVWHTTLKILESLKKEQEQTNMRFVPTFYNEIAADGGREWDVQVPAILDTYRNVTLDRGEFIDYVNQHLDSAGLLPGEDPPKILAADVIAKLATLKETET